MMQVCPHCNANVGDESQRCPSCGQEMDVFQTIPPPRFGAPQAAAQPPREAAPPAPPRRLDPAPTPPPPPPPVAKKRPRPEPPRERVVPSPSPAPAPPAPLPVAPAQPAYAPPYAPPMPQADEAAGSPGKLRSWLIKQLGGNTASDASAMGPQPPVTPYPQPPVSMTPPQLQTPAQPPSWASPQPPMGYAPPQAFPIPPAPMRPPEPDPVPQDDGAHTVAFGADLAKFKMASSLLTLQIFDRSGHWHDWTPVGASGLKVGRTEKNARFPELNSMAVKHMRIGTDGSRIVVEDLGSVNGVYVKLNRFHELEDGQRFRVGSQVIEFRLAAPLPAPVPLVSDDGEAFWSRDMDVPANLVFIRSDNQPGLIFPITKPDVTILGRESRAGRPVDIALAQDEWASGQHAQIRRDGDRFLLEDLGSRNGTFVQIRGQTEILAGDVMLVGRVLLRAVDPNRPPR